MEARIIILSFLSCYISISQCLNNKGRNKTNWVLSLKEFLPIPFKNP